MNLKCKIGIGTAQFGMPYGISNINGQTSFDEVKSILDFARNEGIELLDTASAYGKSEEVLGNNNLKGFKIISKFMPVENDQNISIQLKKSLKLLKVSSIYGYLAHRPLDVIQNPNQWEELEKLKKNGLIKKFGFSFNDPKEIDLVLEKGFIPEIIQVPFNYFDKRFTTRIMELKKNGTEIHTRSAFLQGLFFLNPNTLSPFFDSVKPYLLTLQRKPDILPGLLLKYCIEKEFIDHVIIGINNSNQLISNLYSINSKDFLPEFSANISDEILMPSKWNLEKK